MAHFRLPVPIILCAANPPGSLDLTYFSNVNPSSNPPEEATTDAVIDGRRLALFLNESEAEDCGSKRSGRDADVGFWEIWEEKESDANDEARDENVIPVAIFVCSLVILQV